MKRLGSLRARILFAMLVVALAPIALVAGVSRYDAGQTRAMLGATERVAEEIAHAWARGEEGGKARAEKVAERDAVRVQVIDASGNAIVDADHDAGSQGIGSAESAPGEAAPTLARFEAELPPVGERREIRDARWYGSSWGCELAFGGALAVCQSAREMGSGHVVLVQQTNPRAVLALADQRSPIVKLSLVVAAIAIALSAWVASRIARPIEKLRAQVLAQRGGRSVVPLSAGGAREIVDLGVAFDALAREREQRAAAKAAFFTDLAHELKGPIATVSTCAEGLAQSAVSPERADKIARLLGSSASKLDTIVTSFLDLARAEAGLPGESRERIAAAELARNVVASLAADDRFSEIAWDVDIDDSERLHLIGVSSRLETALRNVIENAGSFARSRIGVRVRSESGQVRFEVVDDGPGIAPDDLPRVFDRFFTTRPEQRGTGLGLAMTKAIIDGHGGAIEVRSALGEGATFVLRVPGAG